MGSSTHDRKSEARARGNLFMNSPHISSRNLFIPLSPNPPLQMLRRWGRPPMDDERRKAYDETMKRNNGCTNRSTPFCTAQRGKK